MESKEAIMRKDDKNGPKPTFTILKQQDINSRPAHAVSLEERAERWPCSYPGCPLPGSIKATADWFCRYHFWVSQEMGARITEDLKQMVAKGWRGEKDWRDELLEAGTPAAKAQIERLKREFPRTWQHELIQEMERMLGGFTELPYDKARRIEDAEQTEPPSHQRQRIDTFIASFEDQVTRLEADGYESIDAQRIAITEIVLRLYGKSKVG
jgi:hypothetical protein